ncbi:MAG: class I SAM-dependent methyltransferase [Cytophagales bacterium]|nr:class I SAM-dependent methyltransferase [Armatimonadota bacterium]
MERWDEAEGQEPPGTTAAREARQYGDVAAVYDTLMEGVPHGAWLSRIEKAVRERGKAPRSVLDVACGTGIATLLLARRGYSPVIGVDLSADMIRIARTKATAASRLSERTVQFEVQNAATLDLDGATFDLVISLFDSLNYILDPRDLQSAFCRVFAHTAAGGMFAFDLNSLYALAHDLFTQTNLFGPVQHVWSANWDREARLCRVEMAFAIEDAQTGALRRFTETHLQRAYTVPEITEWLAVAGFANIECFGNYGTRPPGPRSDRLLFVCEKS